MTQPNSTFTNFGCVKTPYDVKQFDCLGMVLDKKTGETKRCPVPPPLGRRWCAKHEKHRGTLQLPIGFDR